jgi:hypothetical protein
MLHGIRHIDSGCIIHRDGSFHENYFVQISFVKVKN